MAEQSDKAAKAALGISTSAAVVAALALLTKKAEARPGQQVELPRELLELIIATADSIDRIDSNIKELVEKLGEMGITVQGFPANAESMTAVSVACIAVNTAYNLPDITVPEGMPLHLLAHPFNPPGTFLRVAPTRSACLNNIQSYIMAPTATKDYFIKNANALWVSSTAVPAWLVITTEQRRTY